MATVSGCVTSLVWQGMDGRLLTGADGVTRCGWCGTDPDYVAYHDHEWGHALGSDAAIFEKLCLEGFQAGLSWLTILRKRPAFRRAFAGFDLEAVAAYGNAHVEALMADAGIVRNRAKITAAIGNARVAIALRDEFGSLGAYVERYRSTRRGGLGPRDEMPTRSPESEALSADLRRRGFRFVGPTTMYAFCQSSGLVDDHVIGCETRPV